MTLVLDDQSVRSAFDWAEAADAIRAAYAAPTDDARFPARTMARGDHGWLRMLGGMPAGEALMGLKIIAAAPSNHRVSYLVPLFDQRTADLVALLDGHSITGFRTAATTALAADLLACPGPVRLAVIGSGFEARNHVRAIAALRPLSSVRVHSPRAESRAAFVDALRDLDLDIEGTASGEEAVEGSNVVLCAARSRDESPTLRGDQLHPGMTVLSIGSTLPEQREVDAEVIRRADLMVADMVDEVLDQTGDLLAAHRDGVDARPKTISLGDLVTGRHAGRERPDQIMLYKSVGSAVQDLAVAEMCLRASQRLGLGIRLTGGIEAVDK